MGFLKDQWDVVTSFSPGTLAAFGAAVVAGAWKLAGVLRSQEIAALKEQNTALKEQNAAHDQRRLLAEEKEKVATQQMKKELADLAAQAKAAGELAAEAKQGEQRAAAVMRRVGRQLEELRNRVARADSERHAYTIAHLRELTKSRKELEERVRRSQQKLLSVPNVNVPDVLAEARAITQRILAEQAPPFSSTAKST